MHTITVVIPTYNRSKYLAEAITSVLNQSYQDFQILVSDNNALNDDNDETFNYTKSGTKLC